MANEITITARLRAVKGGTDASMKSENVSLTLTGTSILHNRQIVGVGEEFLLIGDVVVGGLMLIINRDPTNFVKLRASTTALALVELKPGEPNLFRISRESTGPFIIADTAPCEVEYLVMDA